MRRLVQGNQALLIIRQVLALVKLWELELPSVFHFFTEISILSPTQLPSRLITKRFNQHISGWNLLTDVCWKHFCVTFFLLVYLSILLLLDNGVVRLAGLHKFCWSNMESHSPRWTLLYQRGVDIVYPTSVLTAWQWNCQLSLIFPFLGLILGQWFQAQCNLVSILQSFLLGFSFSHDFFSLLDIHKASEEIANVNNTKIEKIRLHLIEVWLWSRYLFECFKEMVGSKGRILV